MGDNLNSQMTGDRLASLIKEASGLNSSVVSDRSMGYATVLNHHLTNFTPEIKLIGPVHLVLTDGNILPVLQGLDAIQSGHILVIQDTIGDAALLGDIIMLAAKKKGIAGLLCTGKVRDIADASRLELPVWAASLSPLAAPLGTASPMPDSVVVAGHTINSGDWLFGDRDGLVHVPAACARLVIKAAAIKNKKERVYKTRINNGEGLIVMMNIREHLASGAAIKVEF